MSASFSDPSRTVGRLMLAGFLLTTLGLSLGCDSKKGAKDTVTGKVTLNGQVVAGQVVFVGSDGKESASPISPEGTYTIMDPPKGEVKVMVKGTNAIGAGVPNPGGPPPDPKKTPVLPGGGAAAAGVAPPPKYGTAATPLKFNVTGGNQEYNIELEPGK